MLCSPEGPAIELGSAIGWPDGTPILTTEKTLPFCVLITVDQARIPGNAPVPLLSSCIFVLEATGFAERLFNSYAKFVREAVTFGSGLLDDYDSELNR